MALDINLDAQKRYPCDGVEGHENSKSWINLLSKLNTRGVKDDFYSTLTELKALEKLLRNF